MSEITYFAYGSNMSVRRLRARLPGVLRIGVAVLEEHRLAFHKAGQDRSAKCDIVQAAGHSVLGVVFSLDRHEKRRLDRIEGLGAGYDEKQVSVALQHDATRVDALTYYATALDPSLRPFDWYLRHVLEGALEAGLPEHYVAALRAVETRPDHDPVRAARELRIYER